MAKRIQTYEGDHITVTRHYPFHGSETIVEFDRVYG